MKNFNYCQNKTRINNAIKSLEYFTNKSLEDCDTEDDITEEEAEVIAWNSQLCNWLKELKDFWNKKSPENKDILCNISDGLTRSFEIAYNSCEDSVAYCYLEIANWLIQLEMYRLLQKFPELPGKIGINL